MREDGLAYLIYIISKISLVIEKKLVWRKLIFSNKKLLFKLI